MQVPNKNIIELIDENFIYARALDCLGIDFMDYADKTLQEICSARHLKMSSVLCTIDSFLNEKDVHHSELNQYPVNLIMGYLRHKHHVFIKDRLPYIHKLITMAEASCSNIQNLEDLALVFPIFLDDFIHHIHEEEDTLFRYITELDRFSPDKPVSALRVLLSRECHTLSAIAEAHCDDDEMAGLRELVTGAEIRNCSDITVKTMARELAAFDRELAFHAKIENTILFPKAILLEQNIFSVLDSLSTQN